jgi:predicted Ser/Thr protein kinase
LLSIFKNIPFIGSVSTVNKTAYSGHDFIGKSDHILTFNPTSSTPSVLHATINITEEMLVEGAEKFTLTLTTNQADVIIGQQNETEIQIQNNDKGLSEFVH